MALTINHQTDDISATSGSVNVSSDLTVDTNTLYVDSTNNNVGIGVVPETWGTYTPLQVQQASLASYTNGDARLTNNAYYSGGWKYIDSRFATQYLMDASNGVHTWSVVASGTADAAITWSEVMRIDQSKSLRLGTTGNEGITNRLTVKYNGAGTEYGMVMKPAADNTVPIYFQNASGGNVGSVGITASSTSYNTSSDHRLKENVTDVTDGITRVKQLEPKRFNFIADPDRTVDGFLAHEAQTVVPEAITGTHNEVDDDGNPVYQGIDQAKLVPLLTAALKESIAKIEALEARVTALEGN